MNANGSRYVAFQDGLTADERDMLAWLGTMPPAMQVGYSHVMLRREIDGLRGEIAAMRRPVWRTAADRIGYVIGVALAALLGAQAR